MNALWYPAAPRRPGPARKDRGGRSPSMVKSAIFHSAEGNWAALMGVLASRTLDWAWHLSNPVEGPLVQHYALDRVTWHARGYNTPTIGVENEGVAGVPLSASQTENLAAFSAWLVQEDWLPGLTRPSATLRVADATLLEHNEVGSYIADPPYPTACPSGRIPWQAILEMSEEDDEMTKAQIDLLIESVHSLQAQITESGEKQQAQIDGLIGIVSQSAHTHNGTVSVSPEIAALKALAEENRRRLEALGAAASGE